MKHRQIFTTLVAMGLIALAGCATTESDRKSKNSTALPQVPIDQAFVVSVCRPKSLIRFFEKPDFVVNGAVVGEIPNGSINEFVLKVGDKFDVILPANLLWDRWKASTIVSGVANEPRHIYMKLTTLPGTYVDWRTEKINGITVASEITDSSRATSELWYPHLLNAESFQSQCAM